MMIHADRLAKAQHSLAVAAFAVYVHTCLRIYVSRLTSFSYTYVRAWLIAYAHKEGRVFICRLFQRSYYDEYSSLENTIQWTFLLFVWLPALFPLHLLY